MVIALAVEQFIEAALDVPMGELGAIKEHDAGGKSAVLELRTAAQDRLAAHVAVQQLPDIARREDIRIDNQSAAAIAHQFGWQETDQSEGLQIIIVPGPRDAM